MENNNPDREELRQRLRNKCIKGRMNRMTSKSREIKQEKMKENTMQQLEKLKKTHPELFKNNENSEEIEQIDGKILETETDKPKMKGPSSSFYSHVNETSTLDI